MAVRFTNPFAQWVSGNSIVGAGYKLYFYTTATSTPKNTYSDNDLLVANANPVVADADGKFSDIFLSPGQYKVVLKTSADVTVWTADPVGDSQANVDATGTFTLSGDITPAQITADQNNYNPTGLSGATVLRLNSDAARNITGLSGGSDGRLLIVYNVGSFNIVLKDESSSSTAANRFALQADVTIAPDVGVILQYDSTSSRWRAQGGTSLDSLTSNGADIASATTTNLTTATGDTVDVTGTTTITAITLTDGDERRVRFTGALTLTHGASLVLPGAANITTAAGDIAVFRGYSSSVVRCVDYQKASGLAIVVAAPTTLATPQASTSGTSIDFTSIPAGTKTITVMFDGVSTNGTSVVIVQIGDSGGVEATGYTARATLDNSSQASYTTGFGLDISRAAGTVSSGALRLTLMNSSTNTWVADGTVLNAVPNMASLSGIKALSAELDRVRITTVNGTDAFDAGSINISYGS